MFQVGKAMATAVRMWMNVWPIMAAVPPLLWCNAWTPWVPSTVVPALQVWGEKSYRCNYSSMNSGWPTETVCNTYHACISIMCVCRRSWPYINESEKWGWECHVVTTRELFSKLMLSPSWVMWATRAILSHIACSWVGAHISQSSRISVCPWPVAEKVL